MAQVLTQAKSAHADADQIIFKPREFNYPAVPFRIPPLPRPRLSFRAINLPGRPGYDPELQRHHLLPLQLLTKSAFGAMFDCIGPNRLSLDDFHSNGLLLPANDAAALRIGLPLHRGPHRQYNAMVIERVGHVEARWSIGRLRSPQAAIGEAVTGLQAIQQQMRGRLLDPGLKRLALNRFDPLGSGVDFTQIDTMADMLWPDDAGEQEAWVERPAAATQPSAIAAISVQAANVDAKLAWAC